MKVIHAHVYDPTQAVFFKAKKSDPAIYFEARCEASDRCELYARGECAAVGAFGSCKHGRMTKTNSPGRRSNAYGPWLRDRKAQAASIGHLKSATRKMARVGDYVWLPYSQMDLALGNREVFGSGQEYWPLAEFTAAFVARAASARPVAFFGGEITSYQREEVPKFITHLTETFPDIAREAAALSPRVAEIIAAMTKVGRKAKVLTILPNVGLLAEKDKKPAIWAWDGKTLTTDKLERSLFVPFESSHLSIVPDANTVAIITDDAQVGPLTEFVD